MLLSNRDGEHNFSLTIRAQSEARAHRIGQNKSVEVIDLCARNTIDEKILKSLSDKIDLAAQVTGDIHKIAELIRT